MRPGTAAGLNVNTFLLQAPSLVGLEVSLVPAALSTPHALCSCQQPEDSGTGLAMGNSPPGFEPFVPCGLALNSE